METSENFVEQDHFKQILLKVIQEKICGRSFRTSILEVFHDVLDFAGEIVEGLEASGQMPQVSCRSGCSYCCYSQVKIIPIEALSIYAFMNDSHNNIDISDFKKRLAYAQHLTAEKSIEQVYALKKELPCIFLSSRKCSIYSIRPSVCRSWNSLDSHTCITAFNSSDHNSTIDTSGARNYVFGAARELFQTLTSQRYLQSDALQMNRAMFDCFNVSDPFVHWADGNPLFNYQD